MTSTLEQPGPFDALEKAMPEEPIFTLLGRDPCAPPTITEWARLRRNDAIKRLGDSKSREDKEALKAELIQCAEAEEVALAMADWRNGMPEEILAERARYDGRVRSAEELDAAKRLKRLEGLLRNLRESAYQLCEAKDGLAELGLVKDITVVDLGLMLTRINELADDLTPKRRELAAQPQLDLPGESAP